MTREEQIDSLVEEWCSGLVTYWSRKLGDREEELASLRAKAVDMDVEKEYDEAIDKLRQESEIENSKIREKYGDRWLKNNLPNVNLKVAYKKARGW